MSNNSSNCIIKLSEWYDTILKQAYSLRLAEQMAVKKGGDISSRISPLIWWRDMKSKIDTEFGTEPIECVNWHPIPVYSKTVLDDDYFDDGTVNQHFLNQTIRIPREVKYPNARKVLQLALNVGQGLAQGVITEQWQLSDFLYNNDPESADVISTNT